MGDHETPARWEEHKHDALVHSHDHPHVTHNFNDRTTGFDHLSSSHEHEHDHAALEHAHFAHQNFESEHRGEAHDHDHGEAVKVRKPRKATAAKRTSASRRASVKEALAGS